MLTLSRELEKKDLEVRRDAMARHFARALREIRQGPRDWKNILQTSSPYELGECQYSRPAYGKRGTYAGMVGFLSSAGIMKMFYVCY